MVSELIALMIFAMVLVSVINKGVIGTFQGASPKLGARVEKHLETGSGFQTPNERISWELPPKAQGVAK